MYLAPPKADIETDVIVIGTGPGGLSATAAAHKSGAKVVVIEANNSIGGNGVLSTGWIAFVDSSLQRSLGIHDSVDRFMADNEKLIQETTSNRYAVLWDRELTRLYAEKSSAMYEELVSRGCRFDRLIKRPLQTSVDRLAAVEDTQMFPAAFKKEFEDPEVSVYLKCTARKLILKPNGSVAGVVVEDQENHRYFNVHADRGVVLAAGGYGANQDLRRRYRDDPQENSPYAGLGTCRGDGQLMGQAIGGDLINMNMQPPIIIAASHLMEESIAVNLQGHRFHDEAGPYWNRIEALKKQEKQQAYYIFDDETYRTKRKYIDPMPGTHEIASTLDELAQKLKISGSAVQESVERWNKFLESGTAKDQATGRVQFHPSRRPITVGPFHARPMIAGISLTCGGFTTTKSMQVVDVWGQPIPSLFAAGDCAGGMTPTAEMGGTHLGNGFVLGWVAGESAASTGEERNNLAAPHFGHPFGHAVAKEGGPGVAIAIVEGTSVYDEDSGHPSKE